MKTFRIFMGVLGLLVLAFFAAGMLLPPVVNDQEAFLELLFSAIGIPVLIFNMWAWFEPDMIEEFFFRKKN